MLPDYPKIKARLSEAYHERIRQSMYYHSGIFAQLRDTQMQEGLKNVTLRVDGSVGEMEPHKVEVSGSLQINYKEIEKLDVETVCKLLDGLGEELAKEKAKMFLDAFGEAVKSVGNVIDGKNKSCVDQFFEAIEKIHLDIDDTGHPIFPTILGGKTAVEKMTEAQRMIQDDPDLRHRFDVLVQKKREEWNDREAARNLVE